MGKTEITATKNPFMIFDSSPRNEPCSLGLTTIDKTINAARANSKSLAESLKTGLARDFEQCGHTPYICHVRLTVKDATTAKITLESLDFNIYIVY